MLGIRQLYSAGSFATLDQEVLRKAHQNTKSVNGHACRAGGLQLKSSAILGWQGDGAGFSTGLLTLRALYDSNAALLVKVKVMSLMLSLQQKAAVPGKTHAIPGAPRCLHITVTGKRAGALMQQTNSSSRAGELGGREHLQPLRCIAFHIAVGAASILHR
ncbi:hypothetical protein AAFF_G00134030 [Aldrovandia affinis]|uniref:Uncharacterized protein n=1 Tax=Aldrovandia affinis TaxID=143900 RepID=A0AAD7W912_9TELE|nr:hypothetical protein AAFF_G00134030 [Aldrovandia affinis]